MSIPASKRENMENWTDPFRLPSGAYMDDKRLTEWQDEEMEKSELIKREQ